MISFKDYRETTFPQVQRIMTGQRDSVDMAGIITAHNPNGRPLNKSENEIRNHHLEADLRDTICGDDPCGFLKIQGKFGGLYEESFIVPNIKKFDLISLADKYGQRSVIWGYKKYRRNGKPYFEWQYIDNGQTLDYRDTVLTGTEIQSKEDFFSAVKSKKFVIPFFEDRWKMEEPPVKIVPKPKPSGDEHGHEEIWGDQPAAG